MPSRTFWFKSKDQMNVPPESATGYEEQCAISFKRWSPRGWIWNRHTTKKVNKGGAKWKLSLLLSIAMESQVKVIVIEDYSAHSLKTLFDTHITNDARILADDWRAYSPLKEEYPDLKQTLSDQGKNFKMLHIQIRKVQYRNI